MEDYRLTIGELELFETSILELEQIWAVNREELEKMYKRNTGIRSTQIGALVMFLIKKGVVKNKKFVVSEGKE